MPTENDKKQRNQDQDPSRDPQRSGAGQRSGGAPATDPDWEKEPGKGKNAGGRGEGSDPSSHPWRDRQEGDTNSDKR